MIDMLGVICWAPATSSWLCCALKLNWLWTCDDRWVRTRRYDTVGWPPQCSSARSHLPYCFNTLTDLVLTPAVMIHTLHKILPDMKCQTEVFLPKIQYDMITECIIHITVVQPLYRSTCVSWHRHLRTAGFCWSKVVLCTCPCLVEPYLLNVIFVHLFICSLL